MEKHVHENNSWRSKTSQMENHYKTMITKSENKGSDEIKMYQIEMKKIQSKITELYSSSKSEYAKLVLSKQK